MPPISSAEQNRYLTLIVGNRDDWFEVWKDERAIEGAAILVTAFVHKNVLRKVAVLWCNLMPLMTVTLNEPKTGPDATPAKDGEPAKPERSKREEAFDIWRDEFFSRSGWEGKLDFWASLPFFRMLIFATGNLIIKLPVVAGKLKPTRVRTNSGSTLVVGDGVTVKGVLGYQFRYNIQSDTAFNSGNAQGLYVEETIKMDKQGLVSWDRLAGEEGFVTAGQGAKPTDLGVLRHVVGWLPLVHLAYEPQEDTVFGMPIAKQVLEAALDVCSVATDIRRANKKTSKQQPVFINSSGDALDPDKALEIHDPEPTRKADFKLVGGGLDLKSLENEEEKHEREAYEQASVPYPGKDEMKTAPSGSGKAQIMLSAPSRAELSKYQTIEGQSLAELLTKGWNIEHPGDEITQEMVTVTYDPMDSPDPAVTLQRAEFFGNNGLLRQALRELDMDDDYIQQLMVEKEEDKAAAVDDFMAGAADPLKAGEPAGAGAAGASDGGNQGGAA